MATLLQQETQIAASCLADRDDNIAPTEATFETNAVSLLDDINNISSQLSNLLDGQAGNWYDDLVTPSALDPGSQRGVNDLNSDLHGLERKRFLTPQKLLVDVVVGGTDDFVILGAGELPGNTTIAVSAVTTLGTVAEAAGAFGAHSLTEVAGAHALAPKNIVEITDGAGDPILDSGGERIWGLLQSESATDGHTATTITPTRLQISFVKANATHTDLEAVAAADIQGQTIRYCYCERKAFDDLTEGDFASKGAAIDIGAGAATVNRQVAYDNQGTAPVDLTNNAILDLEGPGLIWAVRDDLEANLFQIVEGSAGGASQVNVGADVDEFDIDAAVVDIASGATIGSGGASPIAIGTTDGQIESTAGDLQVQAAAELLLDDGNRTGSTWAQDGIKLTDTTAEWDDYETKFGEVSLFNAICQANNSNTRRRACAVISSNQAANVDISGPATDNNLDAELGDLSAGVFIDDYDVYHNGQYLRLDAAVAGPGDVYPGTSLAAGQLRFNRKMKAGDTLCVVDYAV